MSSISFSEIYSSFFTKIEGYDLFDPNLSEETRNEFLCNYLHSALSDRYVSQLFTSLTVTDRVVDDDIVVDDGIVDYTLKYVTNDFSDSEFVKEMLAYGMALAWVTPKVNSLTNIQMLVGTAQDKFYSQKNHLDGLMSLRDSLENKRNNLIAMRGFVNNTYLDGGSAAASLRSV